jgi:hypothetical protein
MPIMHQQRAAEAGTNINTYLAINNTLIQLKYLD